MSLPVGVQPDALRRVALDAYTTDMFERDGTATVADEPVLDGTAGEPSGQPSDGGFQVFFLRF